MKNKLLPLFFVLGSFGAYSQIGVGIPNPNQSSQLEIFANDKGLLIPRVALTSSKDAVTIKNGNVNSLLIFNTSTISDVKPGYYYWFIDKWLRIVASTEINTMTGTGVPGQKGDPGYPGENISLYVDTATNTIYIQNTDGTWTSVNGKNGIDGKNGISGGNGLPGTKGLDGTIQMYIDYDTGTVFVRDPKDNTAWIPLSATGEKGTDGKDGLDGKSAFDIWKELPGNDGKTLTEFLDNLKGDK
ncbi:hypothetical protein IRZ83_19385, partial [Flavobacterium sp. JLP]|nr:hypothetical protein [Flavobacterium sp. JLP]